VTLLPDQGGKAYALEGVFGDGREAAVRCSPASRRADGGTLQGVGISRKTGYKIFDRYQECGIQGLTDRSRRPYRYANQLPFQVENCILNVKHEHPSWGARKIRERLIRRFSGIPIPAKSTVHVVLDRHGLVATLSSKSNCWSLKG
jgi:putative transposase